MDRPIPNAYWVIPKRFLAGEYPITGYNDARARLALFREAGINYFVDLTEKREMPSYNHLLPVHTKYTSHPIQDMGVPTESEQVVRLLSDLDAALQGNRNIYVHCRAGIGRTGLIIGCYLAQVHGDGRRALRELNELWTQSARSASWPKVPQTQAQADYIERWPTPATTRSKAQSR
jgi:hypothetical protein